MSPAIFVLRSPADLARVRRDAEAALAAGRTVNVFTDKAGERSLVVRAFATRGGILAISSTASLTGVQPTAAAALKRPLAGALTAFEGWSR